MWKICVCSDMQYMYILWYKNVHILYTHIHVYIHIHIWICIHTYMYIHIKYVYPQICKWYHPYGRNKRGTEKPLDENKRGEWKGWLKTQHLKNWDHGIQSHHFMANGKTMETVTDFFSLGSKITADGDWNYHHGAMKLKDTCSLKKSYDQHRQHIKKETLHWPQRSI